MPSVEEDHAAEMTRHIAVYKTKVVLISYWFRKGKRRKAMKELYKFIEQRIRIRITPTSMGKGASICPRNAHRY